jgi:hypothetical protein
MSVENLYFIAIVPPEPILGDVKATLTLLKHNGMHWDIIKEFDFKK